MHKHVSVCARLTHTRTCTRMSTTASSTTARAGQRSGARPWARRADCGASGQGVSLGAKNTGAPQPGKAWRSLPARSQEAASLTRLRTVWLQPPGALGRLHLGESGDIWGTRGSGGEGGEVAHRRFQDNETAPRGATAVGSQCETRSTRTGRAAPRGGPAGTAASG